MKKTLSFFQTHETIILRGLILFALLWMSVGFFPILNIEGDSSLFSAGCERMYNNGFTIPPDYFYLWNMQPLVGILVVAVKFVLPIFSCEQIYCSLTIICSLLFLYISSRFLSKLTKLRWEYCFLLFFLLPESYSISYYANTSIFASTLAMLGFLKVTEKPLNLFSIICLGLAPLMRVDILVIYPVVLFIIWQQTENFKKSFLLSALYAALVLLLIIPLFYLLHANPFDLPEVTKIIKDDAIISPFLRINGSFYTIASLFLIITGLFLLIKQKKYRLLLISAYPIAILYFLNGNFQGCAAKHIQYLIPFVGLLMAQAVIFIKSKTGQGKYILLSIVLIAFIAQSFIGVRIFPASKPWFSKPYAVLYPSPTIIKLISKQINPNTKIEIAIGAGQIIPTADELMLLSGNFFAPFYWHQVKQKDLFERKVIEKIVTQSGDSLRILTTQASNWPLSATLHNMGYEIKELRNYSNLEFTDNKKTITVYRTELERNTEEINKVLNSYPKPYYLYTNWDWQLYFVNEQMTIAEPVSRKISLCR